MAKIIEDVLIVKFSRIVKDTTDENLTIVGSEIQQAIEQVAQELVDTNVVVEVEKA